MMDELAAKQDLVDGEAMRIRDLGIIPDMRAIEDDIGESMHRVIARERESVDFYITPRAPVKLGRAEKLAEKKGYRLVRKCDDNGPRRAPRNPALCICGICKACKLEMRLKALMQWNPRERAFMFPAFAAEIVNLGYDAANGRKQFRGLVHRDRERALNRGMQDIADRSTAIMGRWF
ncbi:MAG TPA: hypothetical protein VFG83_09150 [Kofleriaceae bacterium]|nr:hypothetical protein [Kofleriaceae bacterium]